MALYSILALILSFFVDFLLLLGTNCLWGYPHCPGRCILGAGVGLLYAGLCMLKGFAFLGSFIWRTVFIGLISVAAFGLQKSTLWRGGVFWLLRMALGGAAVGADSPWGAMLAVVCICILCAMGFWRGGRMGVYVPVELNYGDKQLKLTALRDTGNTLFDPVSGQSVLVVGADAAQSLTGLTREQLRQPVESIGVLPGLRLIPYKTVGQEGGFLLGLRLRQVQVGSRRGSQIVAFAPVCLSSEGTYQALTGGAV